MNLSGTLNAFRVLANPSLCLPHHTIATFDQLPIPLKSKTSEIRAVVLDKDNCISVPHSNTIHPPYTAHFAALRAAYPGAALLIVSNSSGTASDAPDYAQADLLERNTGVKVLRHDTKKPGCGPEVLEYFRREGVVERASQVAVVGDRLFTDCLMANLMGGHGVWVRDGVVPDTGLFSRLEKGLAAFLMKRGYEPPSPRSGFE